MAAMKPLQPVLVSRVEPVWKKTKLVGPMLLFALAQDHVKGLPAAAAAVAVELGQHRSSDTVEPQHLQLCLGKAGTCHGWVSEPRNWRAPRKRLVGRAGSTRPSQRRGRNPHLQAGALLLPGENRCAKRRSA